MAAPTNEDIAKKLDDLPDILIARFDDRYEKKDVSNARQEENREYMHSNFITKAQGKIVTTTLSIGVSVLAFLGWFINNFQHKG